MDRVSDQPPFPQPCWVGPGKPVETDGAAPNRVRPRRIWSDPYTARHPGWGSRRARIGWSPLTDTAADCQNLPRSRTRADWQGRGLSDHRCCNQVQASRSRQS